MKRGFEAVLADIDEHRRQAAARGAEGVGMTLVMKVGGASGPLYGTLFMTLGKELPATPSTADVGAGARAAIEAVKARGKSDVGQKTMLDVLVPVHAALAAGGAELAARLRRGAASRRGDHADEGDPRPRLVPRRTLDRPYGSRRALVRADGRRGLRCHRRS